MSSSELDKVSDKDNSNPIQDDSDPIMKLIYEDAERSLKLVRDDTNSWNTRLGVLLGFNATLIKLVIDLPGRSSCSIGCPSCLLLKTLTLVLLVGAIALCLQGSFPKTTSVLIYPKSQLTKGIGASERDFRKAMINERDEMIRAFLEVIDEKAKKFKQALACLSLVSGMVAADVLIDIFFCQ